MEEEQKTEGKNKWHGRLALLSAFLLALFWSLGPFFFWIFLGFTAFFVMLALRSSGFSMPTFNRPQQPANPYVSYRNPPVSVPPVSSNEGLPLMRKVLRFIAFGFGSLLLFLFIVGTFLDDDEVPSADDTSTEINSEPIENDDANAWNDKGNTAFSQSNYDSALIYYDRALKADPENQYALYNKALVFSNRQDYRKSNRQARKCLQDHPDYNPAWWLLGYNYSTMNMTDSAVVCLETAYNNNFDEPDFLELMAEVYLKKDNRPKAIEFYIKVIAKDSSKTDALRKLAELDPSHADFYRKKANEMDKAAR